MGQILPTTSTNISGIDSESLSQIMESIKSTSPLEVERKHGASPANSAADSRFTKTGTPYISPVRDHLNVLDGSAAASSEIKLEDGKSIDFGAGKDELKNRSSEIEIKMEKSSEFVAEQITHDDNDATPVAAEKKSSSSRSSGENSKKSKSEDASANKSASSSSSRSSKSSKKSKHSKVESSKKSSRSEKSNKSDKTKPNDSSKKTEQASTSSASSSKKTKDSRKRVLKTTKRPNRKLYSDAMQLAKRGLINLESLSSLMKTPSLSIRNQDLMAECNESPQSLYDFSTWEAWMNHPVKRFKPSGQDSTRTILKELQEMYTKQNVRMAEFKIPPNSVESKSPSDGLQTSDEDADPDYYNDSGSVRTTNI